MRSGEANRGCTLTGSVDNVTEPNAVQVRVQLVGRPPLTAGLGEAEPSPSGSGRLRLRWTADLGREELRALPQAAVQVTVLANMDRSSVALRRTFAVHLEPSVFGILESPGPYAEVQGTVLNVRGMVPVRRVPSRPCRDLRGRELGRPGSHVHVTTE